MRCLLCAVVYVGYCVVGIIALIGLNLFAWGICWGLLGAWLLVFVVVGLLLPLIV